MQITELYWRRVWDIVIYLFMFVCPSILLQCSKVTMSQNPHQNICILAKPYHIIIEFLTLENVQQILAYNQKTVVTFILTVLILLL